MLLNPQYGVQVTDEGLNPTEDPLGCRPGGGADPVAPRRQRDHPLRYSWYTYRSKSGTFVTFMFGPSQ